jgi:glutaredoxin
MEIIQYKWAGKWGPFKIKIMCGECSISESIVENILKKKFPNEKIDFKVLPWLDNWYKVIWKGGWHAPIITVNGKIISQGKVLDFHLLEAEIRSQLSLSFTIEEKKDNNIVFTKNDCPFCVKAKDILKRNKIDFEEKEIIENADFASQFFSVMKNIFPKNKTITVPQVFLDGKYIGGLEELEEKESKGFLKK